MNLNDVRTTNQVAKILGCTTRNVVYLVRRDKKLNPIKFLDNGTFLFDIKDVEFYLSKKSKL